MLYDVIENFLEEEDFSELVKQTLNNPYFPLFLKQRVAASWTDDGIYFTHCFWQGDQISSDFFQQIVPVIKKLDAEKLIRNQFNLYPQTAETVRHDWHIDQPDDHKGCILYLNTNDGQTLLRESETSAIGINAIANRALFFNPAKPHCSTTCTDQKFRSNIIFNYE